MPSQFAWAFAALLWTAPGSATECPQQQAAQPQKQATAKGDRQSEQHQRPKWWIDPKLRAELAITDQQSANIEAIWQKDLQKRSDARQRAEKLDAELTKMILDGVEETVVIAQIDRLTSARHEVDKDRLLLLYRMNKLLTPDQRQKLDAMWRAAQEKRSR